MIDLTINTDLALTILTGFLRTEITRAGFSRRLWEFPVASIRLYLATWPRGLWVQKTSWRFACRISPPRKTRSSMPRWSLTPWGCRNATISITEWCSHTWIASRIWGSCAAVT